jgi:acetoacetyl-CoA synthetase
VFLLHSVAGNVFEWHDLLARLKTARPIVAVQARGLNPDTPPSVSVEDMAADYIGLIRAHQPEGPYTLLGYSFGGLLAYEIATRLNRMGESVDFLGLIDTDVQDGALPLKEWLRFRLARLVHLRQRTESLGAAGALKRFWEKARHLPRHHGATRTELEDGAHMNLPPVLRQVRLACEHALAAYNPPRYAQIVTFFRSPERPPYFCDPLIVWRRRAQSVRVIELPGSHITMMLEPHVSALADEIANCLDPTASFAPFDNSLTRVNTHPLPQSAA